MAIKLDLDGAKQKLKNIQTESEIRKRTIAKMKEDEERVEKLRQKIANLEKEISALEQKKEHRQQFLNQKK